MKLKIYMKKWYNNKINSLEIYYHNLKKSLTIISMKINNIKQHWPLKYANL